MPLDPTYLANMERVKKDPPRKEWYTPLLNRLVALSRRDIIILLVVALLIVLLIWRPSLQDISVRAVTSFIFLGALFVVVLTGVINNFLQGLEPGAVSLRAVQDAIRQDASPVLTWITSNGGPLLLASKSVLPYWEGADPPSNGRKVEATFRWQGYGTPATDYDRACDVDDYLDVINIGSEQGLVLGGEPLPTAWWSADSAQTGGILVRRKHNASDRDIAQAVT